MSKVRVLRVIEYIGDYDAVKKQLERSSLPNNGEKTHGGVTMKSSLVGDFPEELSEGENNNVIYSFKD